MKQHESPVPVEAFLTQPHAASAEPRIVLIVEDEDIVRRMLTRVLGDAGYRTLEARDGAEALRMVTFAYPYLHLVITDVLMPELDGRVLGHRLRERWPELPVLYVSAYAVDDLFHRGAPTAGAPFLQKPIAAQELLTVVQGLLT
ncbi:MAG TPA: response regulator [Gemmatimonadales bacterium]|nr:response regulator [Gemmatimonadales bacterium]